MVKRNSMGKISFELKLGRQIRFGSSMEKKGLSSQEKGLARGQG